MGHRVGEGFGRVQVDPRGRPEGMQRAFAMQQYYPRAVYQGFQRTPVGGYYRCDANARTTAAAALVGLLGGALIAAAAQRQANAAAAAQPPPQPDPAQPPDADAAPPDGAPLPQAAPPPTYGTGTMPTSLRYPADQAYAALTQNAMATGRSDSLMALQTMVNEPAFHSLSGQSQATVLQLISDNPGRYTDYRGALYLARSRGQEGHLDRALMNPGFAQMFRMNPHWAAQQLR